jgi:hypothetical protein
MRKPKFGEPSLGAVVGAVVGAVGGLIAITLPLAILKHDIHALSAARTVGLFGFFVCAPIGWILGGQFGPRLESILSARNAGIIGGFLGGLIPVSGFLLWGWALATQ